jgi:hypothetical protein
MFSEHDIVQLRAAVRGIQGELIPAEAMGTVISGFERFRAYLVEFMEGRGPDSRLLGLALVQEELLILINRRGNHPPKI